MISADLSQISIVVTENFSLILPVGFSPVEFRHKLKMCK